MAAKKKKTTKKTKVQKKTKKSQKAKKTKKTAKKSTKGKKSKTSKTTKAKGKKMTAEKTKYISIKAAAENQKITERTFRAAVKSLGIEMKSGKSASSNQWVQIISEKDVKKVVDHIKSVPEMAASDVPLKELCEEIELSYNSVTNWVKKLKIKQTPKVYPRNFKSPKLRGQKAATITSDGRAKLVKAVKEYRKSRNQPAMKDTIYVD